MQISRETIAEWLNGRQSAELCRDQHGFFTYTVKVDAEKRSISLISEFHEPDRIPPHPAMQKIKPDMKMSDLARQFAREHGEKLKPTGMYKWGAGVWIT